MGITSRMWTAISGNGVVGRAFRALSGDVGWREDLARERWIETTLGRIPKGSRLLDAGCGEQQFRRFCSHLQYVGQDFAGYDGRGDGTGGQMGTWDQTKVDIVSDIIAIPEPDASFDAILCTEVLEHVPDPIGALHELARLLKKGGYIILTAPFCSASHFTPFHFSTGFNRYWYQRHLSEAGFEVIEIVANGNFFEYVANDVRMLPTSALRYCSKSVSSFYAVASFLLSLPLLLVLDSASKHDCGSAELACRVYHVFGRRL